MSKRILPGIVAVIFVFGDSLSVWAAEDRAAPPPLRTVSAAEHHILPDTGEDMAPALHKLIEEVLTEEGPAIILLESGVYNISGEDNNHAALVIDKADNLVIRGKGPDTEIVVRNPRLGAFFISESENVWIEQLSIDHDPLPYTQGTVFIVNTADGWFDLAVMPGYPLLSEDWFSDAPKPFGQWGMIFDPRQKRLKEGASDFIFIDRWEQVGRRVWRIFPVPEQRERLSEMRTMDRFVHLARHGKGGAVFFLRSRECGVRDVQIYASPSLAVGAISSDRITVQVVKVLAKPDTDRLLSTNADGVHIQQNKRGPIIENCRFESMADDGINLYYYPNTVTGVISERVLRADKRGVIEPGDTLQLFEPKEGRILLEAFAAEVRDATEDEYRITLDRPIISLPVGTKGLNIYNLSRCGANFVIRGNVFHNHRRHGMMIKAPHGVIADNVMDGLGGYGIVIGNDPDWPEGVIPFDLLVRNNRIENIGRSRWYGTDSRGAAVQVAAKAQKGHLAREQLLEEVTLKNNVIVNPPGAAVYMGSIRNALIDGLEVSYEKSKAPPRNTSAIVLENASLIQMKHIVIESEQRDIESGVLVADTVAAGDDGLTVQDIRIKGPLQMETVRDLRK